jgi:hypothetical protein
MRQLMGAGDSRDVQAVGAEAEDVDSWADLARLRANPRFHPLPDLKERPRIDQIGPVNLHDWIDELCDVLDIDTEVDEALILDLAKVAADNVVRPAAPVTTYLLGYAAGSVSADEDEVEDLAARAQALAEGWDRPSGAPDPDDVDDVVPDDTGVDHSDDTYDEGGRSSRPGRAVRTSCGTSTHRIPSRVRVSSCSTSPRPRSTGRTWSSARATTHLPSARRRSSASSAAARSRRSARASKESRSARRSAPCWPEADTPRGWRCPSDR